MAALAAALAAGLLLVVAVAPAEADTDSADGEQLCAAPRFWDCWFPGMPWALCFVPT
jgi:hypothetical protein